jgi:hypothetical protein
LNIGPKGDGTVPNESVTKLDSIGDWMAIYGESIYGTTRSPFSSEPAWGLFTKKTGKLYTHVFSWPAKGLLKIPSLTNKINKIYLLNDTATVLNYKDCDGFICITLPAKAPNAINSVLVINVNGVPTASTDNKVTNNKILRQDKLTNISDDRSTLQIAATLTTDNTRKSTTFLNNLDIISQSTSIAGENGPQNINF